MDKTTINEYTEQMREQYQHLVSKKPDIGTGVQFYIDAMHQKNYFYDLLRKWIADFREIYDFISDEVNKGGTSFESNTFIQEATKLVDKYNQVCTTVSAIRDRKQKGNKADEYEFYAWNYTITFCDYIKDAFTPLIENCRKDVSAPAPNYDELKHYFKSDFCGYSSGNTDKFKDDLLPLLRQARDGKEAAAIACILYDSKCLNNKKPKSFKPWHQKFCELTNYPFVEYHPKKIRGTNDYTKLLPALYFL